MVSVDREFTVLLQNGTTGKRAHVLIKAHPMLAGRGYESVRDS